MAAKPKLKVVSKKSRGSGKAPAAKQKVAVPKQSKQ